MRPEILVVSSACSSSDGLHRFIGSDGLFPLQFSGGGLAWQ